jgi:putative endopeptidase
VKLSSATRRAFLAAVLASAGSALARGACPPADSDSPSGAEPAATIHGLNPADMNPSAGACKDFNEYANGGWLKANPIPADQSYWGSFSILEESNRASLRKVAEKAAADKDSAPGSDERKVGDFWASCMDESAIEAAGLTPLKPELARIDKIANAADLQAELARLQAYGVNAGFRFAAEQDRRKSTEVIAYAGQGGLGLPDRDYYLKDDDESKQIREKYLAHMQKMFALMGEDAKKAAADAKTVMDLETKLAQASMTRVERRDPEATYNRKTADELAKLTPHFSWAAYFKGFGITPAAVNVAQPKFFEAFDKQLASVPLDAWKTYLRWQLISAAAPQLPKAFVDENFDFYGKTLTGTPENEPRWKRCVTAADGELGFALGKAYVKEYFPPEAKARADAMVKNLIAALRDDLKTLPWMGEATKKQALEKLDKFNPKIGYPEKWRDYSALQIDRGPYVLNTMRGEEFESRRQLSKIGKPVDRLDWQMTPPEVNAYYDPLLNEIVFPAGILQPPFFDAQADDAVNYGAMGAVIGHEMTHGFDDQGRKFDAQGNLRDWWTPDDAKNYEQRSKCVEEQYNSYEYDGQNVNGKLVLGEATADLGGLGIAYKAYKKSLEGKPEPAKIDGLTGDQRFFLGWARGWAAKVRPEFSKLLMNTNPHPLPQFRAYGPPSTLPAFIEAFGCAEGDPMVRKDLCQIW